jgi:hypothetical protein
MGIFISLVKQNWYIGFWELSALLVPYKCLFPCNPSHSPLEPCPHPTDSPLPLSCWASFSPFLSEGGGSVGARPVQPHFRGDIVESVFIRSLGSCVYHP